MSRLPTRPHRSHKPYQLKQQLWRIACVLWLLAGLVLAIMLQVSGPAGSTLLALIFSLLGICLFMAYERPFGPFSFLQFDVHWLIIFLSSIALGRLVLPQEVRDTASAVYIVGLLLLLGGLAFMLVKRLRTKKEKSRWMPF